MVRTVSCLKAVRVSQTYGKPPIAETQYAKHGEMIAQDLPLDFE